VGVGCCFGVREVVDIRWVGGWVAVRSVKARVQCWGKSGVACGRVGCS
jgi:hypothetical protein